MSTPIVPPRPTRASSNGPTAVKDSMPQVPPRPARKFDPSPVREEHTRSPLNEPFPLSTASKRRSGSHLAAAEMPARPPSVSLPSVGQEGSEYASYDQLPPEAHGVSVDGSETSPQQTVNVSVNMPLHQPKASVPQSTAKSRISTVTRTDSTQAAAAGIGKAKPDDDVHTTADSTSLSRTSTRDNDLRRVPSAEPHPLRQQVSSNRSTSSLRHSRPGSVHEFGDEYKHEEGIPEIGMQIPLHPNAGDVQAPSPAPGLPQHTPGVGFFNDGSARAHTRRKSARQQFGPPDSYGLHGHHGYSDHHDQFERDWCAKHPEQAAKEGYNVYGNLNVPRPETALSSEELNRLVNQTNDVGMGTNPGMVGTPTHEIAFNATQEYTSRMNSPRPSPGLNPRQQRPSSGSQPAAESPLRKSFPFNERSPGDEAVEAEEDTIHVDEAEFRANKVTGGGPQDGAVDLGPRAGNTEEQGGWFDERGDGIPILASDEVIKRPGSAFMQPAVPPEPHHDDDYYESDQGRPDSRRSSLRVPSRPSSRPNSVHGDYHGGNLYRFMSHEEHHGSGMGTPLEEIEEYEPLFPEEEKSQAKPKPKGLTRPGLEHHHFPSQDVWEDAPSSVHYSTTVETPEPPPEQKAVAPPPSGAAVFETPEQEQKRKEMNPDDMTSDNKTFAKPHFKAGVQEEIHRPGVQRFPSQDIWEDTPDSMRLVTTVSGPQMDEVRSPPDERPTTSAIPTSQDDGEARATTGFSGVMRRPSVPSRPHRRSKLAEEITSELQEGEGKGREVSDLGLQKQVSPDKAKAPAIPDRPKPTVPARPARTSRSAQNEGAPLAKSISGDEQAVTDTAPMTKAKPAVPARPGGEKIAALKSGFMADLNNRLKLGPSAAAPKVNEPEPEMSEEAQAAPLADSRKGRTRGPARRKPAASPSAAASAAADQPLSFSISTPLTLWSIDESDQLQVPSEEPQSAPTEPVSVSDGQTNNTIALEKVLSDNEAANTEEPTLVQPASPERSRKASLSAHPPGAIGHEGDEPEPSISPETAQEQATIAPVLEASLAEAEPAPATAEDAPAKEPNVVSSQIDAEVGRDAAAVREKAPEEVNIAGPQV